MKIIKLVKVVSYSEDFCPICKIKCHSGCRCSTMNGISNDRECDNGHVWHYKNVQTIDNERLGELVIGSHHKK